MPCRHVVALSWILAGVLLIGSAEAREKPLRAGIVGADTSHAVEFTKAFNDPKAAGPLADVRVVAFYPVASPDVEASRDRIAGFTTKLRQMGVEQCDSMDSLLAKVDVVLIESVDGRPHLAQATAAIKAHKPVFIDKPVAASLVDAIRIYRLAKQHNVPCFSASALRYTPAFQQMRAKAPGGKVLGCTAFSPCHIEPHHPDLFWYGIHGVETLYTIMGTGCETVRRVKTPGEELVVGVWDDGRIGTFRGMHDGRGYGALAFTRRGAQYSDRYQGYVPLCTEIAKFFVTGKPPVAADETLEMFAFMEAADESVRQGGAAVSLADVMKKAEAMAEKAE